MTDPEKLRAAYVKLQSKADKQRNEIRRLSLEVRALRDDLADIKAQRDEMKARIKQD